jgi:hypothetical protein
MDKNNKKPENNAVKRKYLRTGQTTVIEQNLDEPQRTQRFY